jgi:hypothetical protein
MLHGLCDLGRIRMSSAGGLDHASHDLFLAEALEQDTDVEDQIDAVPKMRSKFDQTSLGIIDSPGFDRLHGLSQMLAHRAIIPGFRLRPGPHAQGRRGTDGLWGRVEIQVDRGGGAIRCGHLWNLRHAHRCGGRNRGRCNRCGC